MTHQIAALLNLVRFSRDSKKIAKQVFFTLLKESKELTVNVSTKLLEKDGWTNQEIKVIANGIHNMNSDNCSTRLGTMFQAINSNFHIGHNTGGTDGEKYCSLWLCPLDRKSPDPIKEITLSVKEVRKVDLRHY